MELDIEYRKVADTTGVPKYIRVGTVGTNPAFIDGLATIVQAAETAPPPLYLRMGESPCPLSMGVAPMPVPPEGP